MSAIAGRRGFRFALIRYRVRAWGSDKHPDLNYETTTFPAGLDRRYPFVDISNIDRPSPVNIPKDFHHGKEALRQSPPPGPADAQAEGSAAAGAARILA